MDDKKIIEILGDLVKQGLKISGELKEGEYLNAIGTLKIARYNRSFYSQVIEWKSTCLTLLKNRFGEESSFFKDFNSKINEQKNDYNVEFYKEKIDKSLGVLNSVLYLLKNNLTEDLFYQKEIILFQDLLEQAEEFLKKGYNLATAIYGRIVLELTLREFAMKKGIENSKLGFEQLTIEMRQKGLIHPPFEKSLDANYKIGSMAAHGDREFEKISETELREFLSFVRDKVLNLQ